MKLRHDDYNLRKWEVVWFGPAHEKKISRVERNEVLLPPQEAIGLVMSCA